MCLWGWGGYYIIPLRGASADPGINSLHHISCCTKMKRSMSTRRLVNIKASKRSLNHRAGERMLFTDRTRVETTAPLPLVCPCLGAQLTDALLPRTGGYLGIQLPAFRWRLRWGNPAAAAAAAQRCVTGRRRWSTRLPARVEAGALPLC